MDNFNGRSNEEDSTGVVGAVISDGAMAGLIGGILGSILPIIGLLTRNSDMASFGFCVNILLYFATGILAGYLYYSRKIGYRWAAAVAAIIGGFLTGLLSGAVTGLAFSQTPEIAAMIHVSTSWVTWSTMSAIGASFIAPLTAWIPGFFIPSGNSYSSETSAKEAKQETPFERRRKIRFAITMTSILLIFAIYFCRVLSR
ncbi:MAG TPA: hypothetical protein VHP14_07820 [Anaerolineales bacterium]|nr:hypothetical protein [Anaerolineales bacterium]